MILCELAKYRERIGDPEQKNRPGSDLVIAMEGLRKRGTHGSSPSVTSVHSSKNSFTKLIGNMVPEVCTRKIAGELEYRGMVG